MLSPGRRPPNTDPSKNKPKTATLRSNTRANRATSSTPEIGTTTRLLKAEIIKSSQSSIKSTEEAKKWLYEHEYIIQGEELSTPTLSMALLYLATGRVNTISQLINGICAVAICLDSATPLASNLDLIKEAIEASTAELMSETTTVISNLAKNAIKSISEVGNKCQEFLRKEQER